MKVSIILTSYNHEKFIRESIESVLNQTYQDYELIILDDYSTDNSWNIIKTYKDPRIVAVRNGKNMGSGVTQNAITNIAKGEYIAIHHSDDLWYPEKLEKQVEFLERHKEYGAVFTHVQVIKENGEVYNNKKAYYTKIFDQPNRTRMEWLKFFFYSGNALCHPSVLLRRNIFNDEAIFDYAYMQIPDLLRWINICFHDEIYIIQEKLTKFRIHDNEGNTSGDRPLPLIRASVEFFNMLFRYLKLNTSENFLMVFPEAVDFINVEEFIPEYALAQLCLQKGLPDYYALYGIQLLFQLMNDSVMREKLETLYGFTAHDLVKETGKRDIFGAVEPWRMQKAYLYVDFGGGFNENDKIECEYFIRGDGNFNWSFDVTLMNTNKNIKKLRVDPMEGHFCKCSIDTLTINGESYDVEPYNVLFEKDNMQYFVSVDPQYNIKGQCKDAKQVEVKGKVELINNTEFSNMIQQHLGDISKEWASSNQELEDTKNVLNNINQELESTNNNLNNTNQELEDIKNILNNTNQELEDIKNILNSTNQELEDTKNVLNNTNQELEDTKNVLNNTNRELEDTKNILNNTNQELNDTKVSLDNAYKELTKIKSTFVFKVCNKLIKIVKKYLLISKQQSNKK
jgi:glycosyltransferase involved in cell wall biosynthesis